jgi:hypothetical protein
MCPVVFDHRLSGRLQSIYERSGELEHYKAIVVINGQRLFKAGKFFEYVWDSACIARAYCDADILRRIDHDWQSES